MLCWTSYGTSCSAYKMVPFSVVFIFALLSPIQGEHFYISPTSAVSCPHDQAACLDLNNLPRPPQQMFTSNSIITFLSGVHRITSKNNNLLFLRDVSNLTLTGEEDGDCEIVCDEPFALLFINVSQLSISNLTVTNCSAQIDNNILSEAQMMIAQPYYFFSPLEYFTMFFVQTTDLEVSYVTIQNNTGYGFSGFNIHGDSSISFSTFQFNNFLAQEDTKCIELSTLESVYECSGGGIFIGYGDTPNCSHRSDLYSLNISSTFIGYTANPSGTGSGLTLALSQSSHGVHILIDNVTSVYNSADIGANIFLAVFGVTDNSTVTITNSFSGYSNPYLDHSQLTGLNRNKYSGGGLYYSYGHLVPTTFGENSLCSENFENHENELLTVTNTMFIGNRAGTGAGVLAEIIQVDNSKSPAQIVFEDCLFKDNTGFQGSALVLVQLESIEVKLLAQYHLIRCAFVSNSYPKSRVIDTIQEVEFDVFTTVFLSFLQDILIMNCTFNENSGSALYGHNTRMRFFGSTLFSKNQFAVEGGGISIHGNSLMVLSPNTTLTFIENSATKGGAIYVASENYRAKVLCFWQIDHSSLEQFGIPIYDLSPNGTILDNKVDIREALNIRMDFYNNSAEIAGTALYGGFIDLCLLVFTVNHRQYSSGEVFDQLFLFENQTSNRVADNSLISSAPTRVCMCTNEIPDCNNINYTVSIYPGQSFHVSVITVGQRNGTSPGTVYADIKSLSLDPGVVHTKTILGESQTSQQTGKSCTNLKYTVSSTLSSLILLLRTTYSILDDIRPQVLITLENCPYGFKLSNNPHMCVCDTLLEKNDITCNIDNKTIFRKPPVWIGKKLSDNSSVKPLVIVHLFCPFDYCVPEQLQLNTAELDKQCAHNRTGVVCGSCSDGLSATLGSNHCQVCSNHYLLLVIVFIIVGLLLVFSLYLCNTLNVSVGTINGLIFYANILQINKEIFFPPNDVNLTTVFIAWLNLDLGIEVCFYDGMDTYAKTWLQFAFPLYILVIVGFIIFVSHYSSSVSKIFSTNAVQVLATIFLLLFSKFQRILINCLSYTTIDHSGGNTSTVWLFDGNINYLEGKHISLFIVGNVLLFLFLTPFTLFLLFFRCFQALSTHRVFHWVNKLKPLLDAYIAPYKDNYRYWAGLLLLLRGTLFAVYSFNVLYGPDVILLSTAIVTQLLSIFTWFSGGVYKKWPLNALEFSFFLNLSILSTITLFIRKEGGHQEGAVYMSVTVAMFEFAGIVIYSIYNRLSSTALMSRIRKTCRLSVPGVFRKMSGQFNSSESSSQGDIVLSKQKGGRVTFTTVDTTGDLVSNQLSINDDDSDRFIELREPLMESL